MEIFLVSGLVWVPVGAYLWGALGERIADWIEDRFEK
jgi:hypothetical protein